MILAANWLLAALHAKCGGDGGEDGDDEVDDGFPGFFFHVLFEFKMLDEIKMTLNREGAG